MKVQLSINPSKLVYNLKNAFATKTTFIAELMQNARRSKSPYVHIVINQDVLTVIDAGSGISDMQKLFCVAETGWDTDTQYHENPFGMGWLSALFAAESVLVESWGQRVSFTTSEALNFSEIEVERCPFFKNTIIELHGLKVTPLEIQQAVVEYATGFSIPVMLTKDGERIDVSRHHALDKQIFVELDTCWIRPEVLSTYLCVYMQDINVHTSRSYGSRTIVHLKPEFYEAKMPDRDKLIDQDQAKERIRNEIKGYVRRMLEAEKARLTPEEFIDSCYDIMKTWRMFDLLNDVDLVPRSWFEIITDYPIADKGESSKEYEYTTEAEAHASREDIESGFLRVVTIGDDSSVDDGYRLKMLRYATGMMALRHIFHEGHWLNDHPRVPEVNETDVRIRIINEQKTVYYCGSRVGADVVFCEAYELILDTELGQVAVTINDDAVNTGKAGCIVVPGKETSSQVIDQCSEFYLNDYDYAETEAIDEHENFGNFVALHQSNDSQSFLRKAIWKALGHNMNHLAGMKFIVEVPADNATDFTVAAA